MSETLKKYNHNHLKAFQTFSACFPAAAWWRGNILSGNEILSLGGSLQKELVTSTEKEALRFLIKVWRDGKTKLVRLRF